MENREILAGVIANSIAISIPIDTLVCAFDYKEDNQGYYSVKNPREFAERMAEYLQDYVANQETGLTVLQECLDTIFDEMVCSAEDFINYLEDTEEEQ